MLTVTSAGMIAAFERLELPEHLISDGDGIGAGALGEAERDGGFLRRGRFAP